MCLQLFGRVTPARVADHVVPHKGDAELFWGGELQSLCPQCHSSLKQGLEKSGRLKGTNLDGTPKDLAHPWWSEK